MAFEKRGLATTVFAFVVLLVAFVSIWANYVFGTELYEDSEFLAEERGTVIVSRCEGCDRQNMEDRPRAVIVVEYIVGRQVYTVSSPVIEGHEDASPRALTDRFPVDSHLPVWRSSQNPNVAYLARPEAPSPKEAIFGSTVVLLLFGFAVRWRYRHHFGRNPRSSSQSGDDSSS